MAGNTTRLGGAGRITLLGALVLSILSGCTCGKGESPEAADAPDVATPSGTGAGATPSALTAADLAPAIHVRGPEGGLPQTIVVEFATRVVEDSSVGTTLDEGTRLVLEPEAVGQLSFTSPSTLTFTPAKPLDFETSYRVRLESVQTRSGVLKAPSAEAWSSTFQTPPFGYVRMGLDNFLEPKHEATLVLAFSGPVRADDVRRAAAFQVDGSAIAGVRVQSGNAPERVRVTLTDPRLEGGTSVRLQLRSGLTSTHGGAKSAKAEDTFILPEGKRLHIRASALREGNSGFYVEVACQDLEPAEQPFRTWNDEEEWDYYWGPKGCEIAEEVAQARIRFEPAVTFSVAPSRRGFRLFGDFKRGAYTLHVDAGLASMGTGQLYSRYDQSFSVPARKPQLSFGASGRYLPRSAWRSLAVSHMNLDSAELVVRRIPPENLVFWLSDERGESVTDRVGNVILRRKLAIDGKPDTLTTTYVDVASELPATTRGVLEVRVGHGGAQASSRLLLTDMSLVAKTMPANAQTKAPAQVWAWALGIEDNALLSGVDIRLVKKSGKVIARCSTSGSEGCRMDVPEDTLDPEAPAFALIATKGEDLTYIRYQDLKTEIADSDVQGEAYGATQPYRAAVWSDRGVYRPGDVAHLAAVVRTQDGVAPSAGLPVELRLIDPRERVTRKQILKSNAGGLVTLDVPFEAFADTGAYTAQILVAEREVGTYTLNVEEFVPERMKVTATAPEQGALLGEPVPVGVEAVYLFGGSASDSGAKLTCQLAEGAFRPKQNGHLTYGVWSPGGGAKTVTLGEVDGVLDAQGRATLECPALTSAGGFRGPARLIARAAVFESGSGRSTQSEVSVPVHPERYYLGLQSSAQKVKEGEKFRVSGMVVDWNGAPVTTVQTVELEYSRLEAEYGYWWDEAEGSERYTRQLRPVREGRITAKVTGGKFEAELTPQMGSDSYLVRVRSGKAQTDLVLKGGWSYWSWDGGREVDQTPRPMRAATLPLSAPTQVKVGEDFEVTAKVPYRGRVLFTAETDRILAAEWKEVQAGEVKWTFKAKDFAPNVYVSAFLIKDPHLESKESFLPDRAFGVTHVLIEPTAFTQTVKLTVPAEVRSNDLLEVKLELGPQEGKTFATVAAVDEGILQLTRFQSPDPLAKLVTKRALGVETYETLGWTMLVPPQGNSRSTGGDASGGAAGRVQPVKPVALWSGVIEVPADGKATVKFQVPQYRGQLRVMAVTVDPRRVGHAEARVLVRDPITLQATLPRFLSYLDTVQIPVFLTNLSGKAQDVKVALSAEDLAVPGLSGSAKQDSPLELLGKREGSVRIEDGKSATLVFQARATKSVGAARLTVTASGGGFTSRESLDVPFLPSGPRERVVQRIELADGVNDLKPHLAGWVPTTEQSTVWVSANPYGESFDHLKYLVQYPYGCIEQTTSTTRPLLFVSGLLESVDPAAAADGKVEAFVQAGIQRVLAMQTPAGGFGYWPGATQPVAWGTAYATHMLLDAKKAGFDVPQDRLDDALSWAGKELDRLESAQPGDGTYNDSHYGAAEPYLHYVVALSGKGRKAAVQKLVTRLEKGASKGEQREQVFMLKAALYLAGDRRYEKELRNPDLSPLSDERSTGWSFYSDRRRRGMMLSTLEDLFPADSATEPLAQMVASALQAANSGSYTTQELSWGVTGLGKRLGSSAARFGNPTLLAGGKSLQAKVNPKVKSSERTWALARASEYPSLEVKLDKEGSGKVYALISSQGVRENSTWKVGGEGLAVQRTWRDLAGNVIDVADKPVALADLLFVEIKVTNKTAERVQNLVLVDRLPAGWEIENPRLGRSTPVDWIDQDALWKADYLDVRDDRLATFGAIEAGQTATVVYAVRAVTSGTFTLPPVEVEAMYDPRLWAREAGGQVQVTGPWKDLLL